VILQHIPREHNAEANRLTQSASGYRENQEVFANNVCAFGSDLAEDDWRKEIVVYLENPSREVSRKLRYKAIKFVLLDGRLFYKSLVGLLLQCLGQEEARQKIESKVYGEQSYKDDESFDCKLFDTIICSSTLRLHWKHLISFC
jgi:hypothetical protein